MQSNLALWLAALLFPPVGLFLLWRRHARITAKLAGTVAILAIAAVELFLVYGLRMELDGGTARPFFSFRSSEAKAAAVELHRAAQQQQPPTPPAEEAPTAVMAAAAKPAEPAPLPPPPAMVAPDYWTDFRGPGRLGIYDEMPILTVWPKTGLKRLWKQPVGGGYASFTIAGGLAFTIEQRRDMEVVAAYDVATGREKWKNSWKAHFSESMGGDGPRSTPVHDEGRIYALGAEGELRALEAATGKLVWNKNILTDNGAANLTWAMAAAPLIADGKVIVQPGGQPGKSVVAYDKLTGDRVWSALDDEQAYASPILATLAGKRQLVVVSALRVVGLTIDEGKLLWEIPWVTEYNASSTYPIVVAPNRFFISAGYDHGAAVVELTPDALDGKFTTRVAWQNKKMKNKFNNSVLFQDHVYGLDEGILACVNIETGEQKWKGGRYGYGQILLASDHLVVLSEHGELALVKADPSGFRELAKFEAISGKTWNNPAISGGVLLIRNAEEMAAFQLAAK